jgi:hypothetical protein
VSAILSVTKTRHPVSTLTLSPAVPVLESYASQPHRHSTLMKTRITLTTLACFWVVSATAGPKEDFELFRNGEKLVWDSTGHQKAKGIQMKISYPRTWKAAEGSRPNIVQKFTSDSGRGMEMVMVMTRALPKPYDRDLTESEKQEVVSRDVAKEFVPDGGRLVSHKVTKIDGEVCLMMESELVSERVGLKIGQKMLTFIIPLKGVLLVVQCSTGGDASSGFEAINKHYEEVKLLFLLISSSCVLTEKWKTP